MAATPASTPPTVKTETKGISPKVPVQAVLTIALWAVTYFGLDASPVVATVVGIVVGLLGGYTAPPGTVVQKVTS